MNIPNEILGKWETLKTHGDIKAIAKESGISAQTVRNAFVMGRCKVEVFKAISDFYKAKEEFLADCLYNNAE